jgi:hypothetical protein
VKPIGCNSVDLKRGFQRGRSSIERGTIAGNARKPGTEMETMARAGKPQSWRQANPPGACFADHADRVANKADHATSVLFFGEQARVVFVLSGRRNRFKISEAERVHGALELPDH